MFCVSSISTSRTWKFRSVERHLERLHVEPVAREHAHVVSPARIRRRASAAHVGAVDHVVVDQRGAMDQLDDRAQPDRAVSLVSRISRGKQQQRGTQPLASASQQVAARFPRPAQSRSRSGAQAPARPSPGRRERDRIFLLPSEVEMTASRDCPAALTVCSARSPKNRRKFADVIAATSSPAKFLTFASVRATSATYAGSFLRPRWVCGARKGESVSISNGSVEYHAPRRADSELSDTSRCPRRKSGNPCPMPCARLFQRARKQWKIPPRPELRQSSAESPGNPARLPGNG